MRYTILAALALSLASAASGAARAQQQNGTMRNMPGMDHSNMPGMQNGGPAARPAAPARQARPAATPQQRSN